MSNSGHDRSCFILSAREEKDELAYVVSAMSTTLKKPKPHIPSDQLPPKVLKTRKERPTFTQKLTGRNFLKTFGALIENRLPGLITNVTSGQQLPWSKPYLIKLYGEQTCEVVDCEGVIENQQSTISDFLDDFDKLGDHDHVRKLKVWELSISCRIKLTLSYCDRIGRQNLRCSRRTQPCLQISSSSFYARNIRLGPENSTFSTISL